MRNLWLLSLICLAPIHSARAGTPAAEIIKAGAKHLLGKTAVQAARETAKQAGKRAVQTASKEAAKLAAKRTASSAARHFGDDLVRVGAKSARFTDDLARVSAKSSAQSQRRLSMLAKDWNNSGKTADAVQVLAGAANPDAMIERLWKHRGKIAAGAGVAAVMLHGDDLAASAGEFVVKPVIDGGMEHVASPIIAKTSGLGIAIFTAISLFACCFAVSLWFKTRRLRQMSSLLSFASSKLPFGSRG